MRYILLLSFLVFCSTAHADTSTPQPAAAPVVPAAARADKSQAVPKQEYFESLFNEVEVAKTTTPDISQKELYDKVAKDSVAYGVLKEYPNLQMGQLAFRPLRKNAPHKKEIMHGQELIQEVFKSDQPLSYKDVTDTINQKIADPKSPLKNMDWVVMSNAFRTLKAPGESHEAHMLGDLLAEYILLGEIKKQESKPNMNQDDRTFLSTLYYDLSQLYKSMYKNEEGLFRDANQGSLTLPIDPVYRGSDQSPYDQGYDVPYDALVGRHLDLLGNSLIFDPYDPYDDLAWAELIDFAAFDLMDPWLFDQFSPRFWGDYFPNGFGREDASFLRGRYGDIRGNLGNFRNLRTNRPGINRALNGLTASANPASRLNTTIRTASTRSAATGGLSTASTRAATASHAATASTRAATASHAATASTRAATASHAATASTRTGGTSHAARATTHTNRGGFSRAFRALSQHSSPASFSHAFGGGGHGGGDHAAAHGGGGGGSHAAAAHGGGGGHAAVAHGGGGGGGGQAAAAHGGGGGGGHAGGGAVKKK